MIAEKSRSITQQPEELYYSQYNTSIMDVPSKTEHHCPLLLSSASLHKRRYGSSAPPPLPLLRRTKSMPSTSVNKPLLRLRRCHYERYHNLSETPYQPVLSEEDSSSSSSSSVPVVLKKRIENTTQSQQQRPPRPLMQRLLSRKPVVMRKLRCVAPSSSESLQQPHLPSKLPLPSKLLLDKEDDDARNDSFETASSSSTTVVTDYYTESEDDHDYYNIYYHGDKILRDYSEDEDDDEEDEILRGLMFLEDERE